MSAGTHLGLRVSEVFPTPVSATHRDYAGPGVSSITPMAHAVQDPRATEAPTSSPRMRRLWDGHQTLSMHIAGGKSTVGPTPSHVPVAAQQALGTEKQ